MDRAAVLAMLVSRYGSSATEAGMTLLDEPQGFGPVLDRIQGWLDADPSLDPPWVEPLARYAALDYLADRLANQMDVSLSGGKSYRLNQLFTNVRTLLADAKAHVAWIVDPAATGTGDVPAAMPYAVVVPGPRW